MYWDQAVYKKPEKPRRFPWHQDNGYTFIEPQQYLTCWVALTDATDDERLPVGRARRAPRRHARATATSIRSASSASPIRRAARSPRRCAGSALVFSSLTPHMTGPNLTGAVRKAYILQYAPVGAHVLRGDPSAGPPTERVRATSRTASSRSCAAARRSTG